MNISPAMFNTDFYAPANTGLDVYKTGENDNKDTLKLKKACRDFEAIFLSYMLDKMRDTVSKSDLLSGGRGEEIFSQMRDEALASEMSNNNSVGLAQMIYSDLTRHAQLQLNGEK